MKIKSLFPVSSPVSTNEFTIGIECEVENVRDGAVPQHWHVEEDGSLRNCGREFISPPLPKDQLLSDFALLHQNIVYRTSNWEERFSARTSTHIHVNCLELDELEVRSICMWYALFEPIFFLLVNPIRRNNIHCVGLDQTVLSSSYKKSLKMQHNSWSKYTALNICPLSTYGTLEFRHLQGTDDVNLLKSWVDTLENLWRHGQKQAVDKFTIKNDSAIMESFLAIFKDSPTALSLAPILPSLIGNSLIDIKLSLI